MKIFEKNHTHMPYIVDSNTLLFCQAGKDRIIEQDVYSENKQPSKQTPYQAYDIYMSDWDGNNIQYIGAQCQEASISCSPNCFVENGKIKLTYVSALVYTGSLMYHQFERVGDSLTTLGKKERVRNKWGLMAYCSSENERYIFTPYCQLKNSYFFVTDKNYKIDYKYTLNCDQLKRIIPIANSQEKVIITYVNRGVIKSAIIDLSTKIVKDIKVNGGDVYKCSIYNDTIIHAVRGIGRYSMKLHKDTYELVNSEIHI